jgi:hypothetical protein
MVKLVGGWSEMRVFGSTTERIEQIARAQGPPRDR